MRYVFYLALAAFSVWLMWHTFTYDSSSAEMLISDKVWSDFGQSLPLIRSFSFGSNWTPQNPLFPGEKIRYHFLFYLLVGLLERIGVRIDWALNIPSALGFFLLLFMVYKLSCVWFGRTNVGILAVILLVFNGSLSGWDFLKNHSPEEIFTNSRYPAFGPWDGGDIAAIWNLNVFTNQRHLGLSMGVGLVIIYLLDRRTKSWVAGTLLGVLLLLNQAVFAGVIIFVVWRFALFKQDRWKMLKIGLVFLPWLIVANFLVDMTGKITYHPGFLMNYKLSILNFIWYWFRNLGLHLFLIPLGVLFAPKKIKWLILPLLILFIVPNLFQLSTDMFNNHKLFNLFIAIGVIFSASVITRLRRPLQSLLLLTVTLSGIIDFFALKNDRTLVLHDIKSNPDARFVQVNVPPKAVILNSTWFYHPASLAGRKIFNGYTYFTWSHGYDSYSREAIVKQIYRSTSKAEACQLLRQNAISYVELNDHPEGYLQPNFTVWRNQFFPIYYNPQSGVSFYEVEHSCQT